MHADPSASTASLPTNTSSPAQAILLATIPEPKRFPTATRSSSSTRQATRTLIPRQLRPLRPHHLETDPRADPIRMDRPVGKARPLLVLEVHQPQPDSLPH